MGLFTECDPSSLPDGASALVINDDFIVGTVLQRPGKQSIFTLNPVPSGLPNFNYLKSFAQTSGQLSTLALADSGVMYSEDAINTPGILSPIYAEIEPGSYAQSCTLDDREFIALSNLINGTDIPYSYNGVNFDRLSQVGPGAAPVASTSQSGSDVDSITQNPPVAFAVGPHDWTLISAAPSDTGTFGTPATPGNVLTFYLAVSETLPSYITPGVNIVLAGFPSVPGGVINNDPAGITAPKYYTVSYVGTPSAGSAFSQDTYAAFSVILPFSTYFAAETLPGATFQATIATLTATTQIPNVEVGSTIQVAGAGVSGYDNSWLVTATPNASQLQITNTQLTSGIATYAFTIITGTAPVVGQAVSVTGCLNGPVIKTATGFTSIFNVVNAIVSSVTGSTFSIVITGPNITAAAENAIGIIFGTIFQFDAFAIIGISMGGTIVSGGIVASGVRLAVVSFLTRNGFLSQPSPVATIDVVSGTNNLNFSIPVGPPNVIARVISLTGANGGNFFNIPEPVTVLDNGEPQVNTSTYVNDNVTTQVTLSFSDAVLLSSDEIDIQGSNLFNTKELGSCTTLIPYASRIFAIGEQNKIQNFLNPSFDGGTGAVPGNQGIGQSGGASGTYPLGWTVDPTNGTGGSVVASPLFGTAYQIQNVSGSTQAIWGMITQGAFQDEFEVAIIEAATTYSVRMAVAIPSGPTTGNIVFDLYSPSLNTVFGAFTLDMSTVGTTIQIFTGTLLTNTLAPVPADLIFRLYATNVLNNAQIIFDRIEPFPTQQPNLSTQALGSYVENFEAFDRVTGVVDTASENQQTLRTGFTLYDTLYLVKTGSFVSTQDNGTTEPEGWTLRLVSPVVGTPSIYGVDSGENWALIAGQLGLYYFDGGEPKPMTREIQSLWNVINWKYGHTTWVKNDIVNQRILVGVPLKTPNKWLPTGIIPDNANPTTPNVVLMLNYKQMADGAMVAEESAVHVSSFTGKLLASDVRRKWSIWSIQAPCAAFVTRADTTAPLMIGNSLQTGKIYQLVDGLQQDDGIAIDQRYITSPFVGTETEQALQLGSVRKLYEYMTANIVGSGQLFISTYPNSLDSPYTNTLIPLTLTNPLQNGDMEIPVNETASRLFLQFRTNAIGAGFDLSRFVMFMRNDPWSAVRGVN